MPTLQTLMETLTAGFDKVNERLDKLEEKTYDTKPIWERALAEILEVKAEVVEVKAEVVEIKAELVQVKNKVSRLDVRMQNVERVMVALVADSELLKPPQ